MLRYILTACVLLFAGVARGQDAEARVRVAIALSRVTVPAACDCAKTGVCICTPYCTCPDSKAAWDKMLTRAAGESLPVVVFAGIPRRDVPGALTVGYPEWCSDVTCYKNVVIVLHPKAKQYDIPVQVLPATATDAQILATGKEKPQPLVLRTGEHSHICSRCGTEYGPHTAANKGSVAAHTCPNCGQLNWMPSRYGPSGASSYWVSYAPSFSSYCPT